MNIQDCWYQRKCTNKCSENCAICGDIRAISHFYDFDCDDTCNECGFVRNNCIVANSN